MRDQATASNARAGIEFARLSKDTAIAGLTLNRCAEECLTNGEYSLPRGVAVLVSLAVPHGQAGGVAERTQQAI
jgi:hypothetical protein